MGQQPSLPGGGRVEEWRKGRHSVPRLKDVPCRPLLGRKAPSLPSGSCSPLLQPRRERRSCLSNERSGWSGARLAEETS